MDTKEEHTMPVHYSEDKACRFKSYGKGMYYLEVSKPVIITLTNDRGETDYSFLSPVNANME